MGLIVLWTHRRKTSALCPGLHPNHGEAMGSTVRIRSLFPP
jgi:hypothetical protein